MFFLSLSPETAWSVPMADPTYIIQGSGIHSFLMFAPFFVFKPSLWLQGAFLFLTGPYLASLITANLMEQVRKGMKKI
jgi:hypothetical protein